MLFACGDDSEPSTDPLPLPSPMDMSTSVENDMAVSTAAEQPRARVYLNDPVTDDNVVSEVTMERPNSLDGRLTSDWVAVFNCLNEEGGVTAMPNFGPVAITVSLCKEAQVVRPDEDGHYLSVTPPDDDSDPNDLFAEVMMYHHVNVAHDYFKGTFGFEALDFSLPALVNVQVKTDPPLPFLMPGPDGWVGLSNAAFFPRESWQQFAAQFGLPPRDSDSIIFFQGDKDFAYDSRVIYHEYTHAVVGTSRLQTPAVLDQYGLDNSSRSMNEGLADYFAATIAGDPRIGRYVGVMGLGLRDLSSFRRCPEDTADEVHAQGEIIGSVLWSLRSALGAEVTDRLAFNMLDRFGLASTHNEAAEILLDEASQLDPESAERVESILNNHGLIDCERSLPYSNFAAVMSQAGVPHLVEGKSTSGIPGLSEFVPAYKQFHIQPAVDVVAVKLGWRMSAGGGLTGGGGQVTAQKMAYNRGAPVFLDTTGRQLEIDSEEIFEPALAGDRQSVILGPGCLPESGQKGHVLFLNTGNDQVQIGQMSIEQYTELPSGVSIENCGEPLPNDDMDTDVPDTADAGGSDMGLASDAELPAPDAESATQNMEM